MWLPQRPRAKVTHLQCYSSYIASFFAHEGIESDPIGRWVVSGLKLFRLNFRHSLSGRPWITLAANIYHSRQLVIFYSWKVSNLLNIARLCQEALAPPKTLLNVKKGSSLFIHKQQHLLSGFHGTSKT